MKETTENTVTSLVRNISILKLDKDNILSYFSGRQEMVPGKQIHFCKTEIIVLLLEGYYLVCFSRWSSQEPIDQFPQQESQVFETASVFSTQKSCPQKIPSWALYNMTWNLTIAGNLKYFINFSLNKVPHKMTTTMTETYQGREHTFLFNYLPLPWRILGYIWGFVNFPCVGW